MKNIEIVKHGKQIIAIVVKDRFSAPGMEFFTPQESPQQLAFVGHKKGKIIQAHVHNKIKREINFTQEIDIIKKGKIKVDLYSAGKK